MNWKSVAKYYRSQFLLWVKAFNSLADIHMVDESHSASDAVTYYFTWSNKA